MVVVKKSGRQTNPANALKKRTGDKNADPLLSSFLDNLVEAIDDSIEAESTKYEKAVPIKDAGAGLHYEKWIKRYVGKILTYPLAPHHHRAWSWFQNLQVGTAPPALVECWARGGAKSSTVEAGVVFTGINGKRSMCVYVCATQAAANLHIQAIGALLEKLGVKRAVNPYGQSRGWRMDLLRAENGFNVLAFGLDSALRGIKVENLRPDLIVLDDIDSLDDSADVIEKKFLTITQSVLPIGSEDVAAIFIQNAIHVNSLMNGLLLGERDMLRYRLHAPIVKAIEGLEYEEYEQIETMDSGEELHTGHRLYRITRGTPTWEGKPIAKCEEEMNRFGLVSFLRECQHEVGVGGLFFKDFQKEKFGKDWHVCNPFPVPNWWTTWTSHDYGTGAPCASLVYAANEHGDVFVIAEYYEAGRVSSEQCERHLLLLEKLGLARPEDEHNRPGRWRYTPRICAFDYANTFPPKDPKQRLGEYPVEVWWKRGVPAIEAVKDRKAGWRTVKEYLSGMRYQDQEPVPTFRIFRDQCPQLVRFFERAMANPKDPEDVDPTMREDHCFEAGTMVLTKNGPCTIETIQVGDFVKTRIGMRPVTKVFVTPEQQTINFSCSRLTLRATPNHPFITVDRGVVPMEELREKDRLFTADPDFYYVIRTLGAPKTRIATVYNLEVDEAHEYFVCDRDDLAVPFVLVHNCGDSVRYGLMTRPAEAIKPKEGEKIFTPYWLIGKNHGSRTGRRNKDYV